MLAGFDIARFKPALVCIEAHPEVRQAILDYFAARHYVLIGSTSGPTARTSDSATWRSLWQSLMEWRRLAEFSRSDARMTCVSRRFMRAWSFGPTLRHWRRSDGPPMTSLRRSDLAVALGLAVVLLALGSWMMVPGVIGVYHDDAIYVTTAKALAQGDGYRLINLPGTPPQTKYPILYPFLLAAVWEAPACVSGQRRNRAATVTLADGRRSHRAGLSVSCAFR